MLWFMKKDKFLNKKFYKFFCDYSTRWNDNDIYGHINNIHYYSFFDSAINKDKIDKIISENDFNNYDFIIGPLTNNLFNYLVSATEESGVKIVKPLSKKQNINKRIINTIPNDSILFNKIISHVKNDTVFSEKYIILYLILCQSC